MSKSTSCRQWSYRESQKIPTRTNPNCCSMLPTGSSQKPSSWTSHPFKAWSFSTMPLCWLLAAAVGSSRSCRWLRVQLSLARKCAVFAERGRSVACDRTVQQSQYHQLEACTDGDSFGGDLVVLACHLKSAPLLQKSTGTL